MTDFLMLKLFEMLMNSVKKNTRGTPINVHEHMYRVYKRKDTGTVLGRKAICYMMDSQYCVHQCETAVTPECRASFSSVSCTVNTAAEPYSLTYRKGCSFELYLAQLEESPRVMNKGKKNCVIDSHGV